MKIRLVDYVGNPGGGMRFAGETLKAFARSGLPVDFEVISYDAAATRYRNVISRLEVNWLVTEIEPDGYRYNRLPPNILGVRGTWRLSQMLFRGYATKWCYDVPERAFRDCDLVWFPWAHQHRMPASCDAKCVVGTFMDAHYFTFPDILKPPFVAQERSSVAAWMGSKAEIAAISRTTAQALSEIFAVPLERFTVVPLAFDHAHDWPSVRPRAEWNWVSRPYLVYPANPTIHKNHELLFKAVASWGFKLPLVLIGTGLQGRPTGRAAVLRRVAEGDGFRLGKSLISLGHVENDVNSPVIANAWAVVFPSLSEGYGLVILEALSRGLPVITTRNTGGPEVMEDGRQGFFVPIRSSEAIAEKLETLAADRALLEAMSEAALERARECTWEKYRRSLVSKLGIAESNKEVLNP